PQRCVLWNAECMPTDMVSAASVVALLLTATSPEASFGCVDVPVPDQSVVDVHARSFGEVPVEPSPSVPSPSLPSVSGGKLEDLLILAVIVAAALPIVLYAMDEDVEPEVMTLHNCPRFHFGLMSGAVGNPVSGSADAFVGARSTLAQGVIGVDASIERVLD